MGCLLPDVLVILLVLVQVSLFFFRGQRKKSLAFILLCLPFVAQQLACHYGNFTSSGE